MNSIEVIPIYSDKGETYCELLKNIFSNEEFAKNSFIGENFSLIRKIIDFVFKMIFCVCNITVAKLGI